jgi:hypothetical protein
LLILFKCFESTLRTTTTTSTSSTSTTTQTTTSTTTFSQIGNCPKPTKDICSSSSLLLKGTRSNLMMKSAIDPEFTLKFDCSNPDAYQIQKSTGEYLVWEANYIGKPSRAIWVSRSLSSTCRLFFKGESGANSFWKVTKKWTRRELDYYQITVPDHSKFVLTASLSSKLSDSEQNY